MDRQERGREWETNRDSQTNKTELREGEAIFSRSEIHSWVHFALKFPYYSQDRWDIRIMYLKRAKSSKVEKGKFRKAHSGWRGNINHETQKIFRIISERPPSPFIRQTKHHVINQQKTNPKYSDLKRISNTVSMNATSTDSVNHRLKIFWKKNYICAEHVEVFSLFS